MKCLCVSTPCLRMWASISDGTEFQLSSATHSICDIREVISAYPSHIPEITIVSTSQSFCENKKDSGCKARGMVPQSVQSLRRVRLVWPHGLLHARLPCPSPTPRACSNPCPLSRWCHPLWLEYNKLSITFLIVLIILQCSLTAIIINPWISWTDRHLWH